MIELAPARVVAQEGVEPAIGGGADSCHVGIGMSAIEEQVAECGNVHIGSDKKRISKIIGDEFLKFFHFEAQNYK